MNAEIEVDARTHGATEGLSRFLCTFDRLRGGEALVLTTLSDPAPLLRYLQHERPNLFDWSPVSQDVEGTRIEVRRRVHAGRTRQLFRSN